MSRHSRLLSAPLIFAVAIPSIACSEQTRSDVAASAFIKAVNLKCKLTMAEAKLAWDLADELGADEKARAVAGSAARSTDRLVGEIDRLDGPVNVANQLKRVLESSKNVIANVSNGQTTAVEGRATLEDLRRQARDQGFGECVR